MKLSERVAAIEDIRERLGTRYWRHVATARTVEGLRQSYQDAEMRVRLLQEENTWLRHELSRERGGIRIAYPPDAGWLDQNQPAESVRRTSWWKRARTNRRNGHAG